MRRSLASWLVSVPLAFGLMLSSGRRAPAQDEAVGPEISPDSQHDLSPPLRDIPYNPDEEVLSPLVVRPILRPSIQRNSGSDTFDPVLQDFEGSPDAPVVPVPMLNFLGLGRDYSGYTVTSIPPDTNAAMSPTQIVEWVNTSFIVFDRSGHEVQGPRPGTFFWSGFTSLCQHNDGDPIIKYDAAAKRWFASQSVLGGPPFATCIAISQTDDATGPYYRYEFPQANFPDYPKFAIWPDPVNNAYFGSFNQFNPAGTVFLGPKICAYDRASMLVGASATQSCFTLSSVTDDSLLASDLDWPLPSGITRDNFVVGSLEDNGPNEFSFFKYHADFLHNIFTLSPRTMINVAPFTELCSDVGFAPCVPEMGGEALGGLGDRLMYRNAYRFNYGHESLVLNHSVKTVGGGGVRWYEIRDLNTSPTVFQQGTYAPGASEFRWMGSIAMDHVGDICVGFSVSSSAMHPAIRYACRTPSDALGVLGQGEASIIEGTGSQTDGSGRWGDYTSMVVDPVDDCTFMYANEYHTSPNGAAWNTRIATFKFPGCHK